VDIEENSPPAAHECKIRRAIQRTIHLFARTVRGGERDTQTPVGVDKPYGGLNYCLGHIRSVTRVALRLVEYLLENAAVTRNSRNVDVVEHAISGLAQNSDAGFESLWDGAWREKQRAQIGCCAGGRGYNEARDQGLWGALEHGNDDPSHISAPERCDEDAVVESGHSRYSRGGEEHALRLRDRRRVRHGSSKYATVRTRHDVEFPPTEFTEGKLWEAASAVGGCDQSQLLRYVLEPECARTKVRSASAELRLSISAR
jgi:hypothetical protein